MAEVTDVNPQIAQNKPKLKVAELQHFIALKMMDSPLAPRSWAKFPHKFHVYSDRVGKKAVLEEVSPGLVEYRDEIFVTDTIIKYCYGPLAATPNAAFSHKQAVACKNLWFGLVKGIEQTPFAVAEKSAPGLAFRRLPFDAPAEDPIETPLRFEEFLSRCSQPDVLCAFIGSLFYPEADRQQYLYLYGEGLDGKGSLLRMLFHVFGSAYQSLQPKGRDDRFYNMKIYGKRLVAFPDCDDMRFFSSPDFKSLTGNDPVYFEDKGRMGFSDIPMCKFIAASNHRPNITSQRSDLRRLIFIDVKPVTAGTVVPNFEKLLLAEGERIVRVCKAAYLRLCPDHGTIPCDSAEEVAFESEGDYLEMFGKYFNPGTDDDNVMGADVRTVLRREGIKSPKEQRHVREIWARQFNLAVKHTKRGNVYCGLKWRPDAFKRGEGETMGDTK